MNKVLFRKQPLVIACAAVLASASAQQAHAAGFQLIEQSVSAMGTAYAGAAALGNDASSLYFNPAGMSRLEGRNVSAGVHVVKTKAEFTDSGSYHGLTQAPFNVTTATLGTGTGGDAGDTAAIPNVYYTQQINDKVTLGFGINAPFGLATEYEDGWMGRYHALHSEVKTVNFNPSLSYKAMDNLSLGAGINFQRIDAELTNAIDFGAIDVALLSGALGLTPGASDGTVKVEGDDTGWGYNLGLLLDINESTRLGVSYRSPIKYELTGRADFTVPGGGTIEGATGMFVDTGVKSKVELPGTVSVSLFHAVNSEWSVMADITQTQWNSLPELRFEFDNPNQADGVTTLAWRNSMRYSLGAAFAPSGSRWTWRAGLALDETPIPDAAHRTPRIPGEDRLWVALGAGFKASDSLSFDVGYAHLFVDDPQISKTAGTSSEDFLRGALQGDYDASVDILSAQLNWAF